MKGHGNLTVYVSLMITYWITLEKKTPSEDKKKGLDFKLRPLMMVTLQMTECELKLCCAICTFHSNANV